MMNVRIRHFPLQQLQRLGIVVGLHADDTRLFHPRRHALQARGVNVGQLKDLGVVGVVIEEGIVQLVLASVFLQESRLVAEMLLAAAATAAVLVAVLRHSLRQFDAWNERRVGYLLVCRVETQVYPVRHTVVVRYIER